MKDAMTLVVVVAGLSVIIAAALIAQRLEDRRIAAAEAEEARSFDAACEELHQDEMRKAQQRHPVRRMPARRRAVPCEPRGEPLTAAEAEALAALWWSVRNETARRPAKDGSDG